MTENELWWAEELLSVVARPKIVASASWWPKWALFSPAQDEVYFGHP